MNSFISSFTLKQPKSALNPSIKIIQTKQDRIKPIFRNQVKWRCLIPSDVTYINKYKPKMLSTVELKRFDWQKIKGIRSLCKALTDTKRVSSLIITDPDNYKGNFARFGHLLKTTSRWQRLTLLFMDSKYGKASLNQEKLKNLVRLRRCKDLLSLKLFFDCHVRTKRTILKSLSQQVQGLPNLRTLSIDISACYEGKSSPILTFKYPRSLSFLHLNFEETDSIDSEFVAIFASNIQRCHQLDKINLNFQSLCENEETSEAQIWTSLVEQASNLKTISLKKTLSDHEFDGNKNYLDSFQHLKTLENLNIDFNFNLSQFSNRVLPAIFFTHIASLTNLRSLNLTLSCRKDHPVFLKTQSLRSLAKLEDLRLDLIHIETRFLQDLAGTLSFLRRLRHFELILFNLSITDEDIVTFSSSFSQLSQLRNLSLNLRRTRINPKTIKILSKNIAHLNLTSLKIILDGQLQKPNSFLQKLSAIWESGKGLTPLFSALYGLKSLENLSLDLSGFDVCINEFKHFSLALKELQQLRALSLELPRFDSGNNFESLKRFLSSLQELKKLNSLLLDFTWGSLSDTEVGLLSSHIRDFSRSIKDLELRFEYVDWFKEDDSFDISVDLVSLSQRLLSLECLESLFLEIRPGRCYFEFGDIHQLLEKNKNLKNLTNCKLNGFKI